MKYGYHAESVNGCLEDTLQTFVDTNSIGSRFLQIYLGSPYIKESKKLIEDDVNEAKKIIKKNKLKFFIHSPHTVKLTNNQHFYGFGREILINYLNLLDEIGGVGIVIHPGSYKEMGYDKAFEHIVKFCIDLCENTKGAKIILENCAGEKSLMMGKMDEMMEIYKKLKKYFKADRIGFCIDTCHLFAAGEYDIREKKEIDRFYDDFDKKIGLENITLFHLNDSIREFNCHVDRHESLGKGEIWKGRDDVFVYFCNKFKKYIMIGEEDIKKDYESLKYVKKMFDL